jgi:hypothetical protein
MWGSIYFEIQNSEKNPKQTRQQHIWCHCADNQSSLLRELYIAETAKLECSILFGSDRCNQANWTFYLNFWCSASYILAILFVVVVVIWQVLFTYMLRKQACRAFYVVTLLLWIHKKQKQTQICFLRGEAEPYIWDRWLEMIHFKFFPTTLAPFQ